MSKNEKIIPFPGSENKREEGKKSRDDGLSFKCEICQDTGCAQCGWLGSESGKR